MTEPLELLAVPVLQRQFWALCIICQLVPTGLSYLDNISVLVCVTIVKIRPRAGTERQQYHLNQHKTVFGILGLIPSLMIYMRCQWWRNLVRFSLPIMSFALRLKAGRVAEVAINQSVLPVLGEIRLPFNDHQALKRCHSIVGLDQLRIAVYV